ncbi:MAG: 3-keto-disaccharide hydrolase [Planctomycetota bacterium]|jgi:hypothetical protein
MKSFTLALAALAIALPATADHHKHKLDKALFNGKDLTGWKQLNGTATYEVRNKTIVGTTAVGSPNSFLCTTKRYGNFVLEFEVKVDDELNSGVQIRSRQKETTTGDNKNDKAGRVYGPQVEIEASGKKGAEAGYVYGEAYGGGWRTPKERLIPHQTMKDGEWNHFKIIAEGPRIRTWINGEQIEDLTDEAIYKTHPKGFIGLQVHGIGQRKGPFQVRWRNIKIKELK